MPGKISKKRCTLLRLYKKQAGKCHYCQEEMLPISSDRSKKKLHTKSPTIEHLYPKGHPRRDDPRYQTTQGKTLVAACHGCNQQKNEEFRAVLLQRAAPKTKGLTYRQHQREDWQRWIQANPPIEVPRVGKFRLWWNLAVNFFTGRQFKM